MKTSETLSKLPGALLTAQRAITFAAKDATNPHFKNQYAALPAVIDAIKPALNAAGIVFMQTGSPSDDGRLSLTTRLMHESGEWVEDTLTMPLPKQDPQGYGSAMTYARRYALAAITGLYQDDDDGNAASGAPAKATITPTTGVWEALDEDTKANFETCAADVKMLLARGDVLGAVEYIEGLALEPDHKVAFWTRFDSKQRSAMKSAAQQLRKAA